MVGGVVGMHKDSFLGGCYRDDTQVDVLGLQWVGAGALQDAEVRVALLDGLVNAPHGLHGLHAAGHHHGAT